MKEPLVMIFAAICFSASVAAPGNGRSDEGHGNGHVAAEQPTPQELAERTDQKYTPDVVALLEAKYWRDISNDTGRAFWHGKKTETVADPSNMVNFVVYEDGRVFKEKAKVMTPAERVKKANEKLPRTVNNKGVPKVLAEAREKRSAEKTRGTVEVNREVKAGGEL